MRTALVLLLLQEGVGEVHLRPRTGALEAVLTPLKVLSVTLQWID